MHPTAHRPAYWLNGLTWTLLGLCLLLAVLRPGGYDAVGALLLTLPVAGLGGGLNLFLFLFLWYSLQGHGQRARPYLLGFVFLLLGVAVQVAWL